MFLYLLILAATGRCHVPLRGLNAGSMMFQSTIVGVAGCVSCLLSTMFSYQMNMSTPPFEGLLLYQRLIYIGWRKNYLFDQHVFGLIKGGEMFVVLVKISNTIE